jgi:catechol 2,3-dioxygenase-like lactoylglutathione lyase family enzyme
VLFHAAAFVMFGLFASQPAATSPVATAPPFTAVTGTFFALSVPDLAASVAWYTEKLGLKSTRSMTGPDDGQVAILEGHGLILELVHVPKAAPSGRAVPYVHGLFKVGVIVDDFDGAVARLKARGVEIAFGPYPAREGQRANVLIRDNAGNLIQLFGR